MHGMRKNTFALTPACCHGLEAVERRQIAKWRAGDDGMCLLAQRDWCPQSWLNGNAELTRLDSSSPGRHPARKANQNIN